MKTILAAAACLAVIGATSARADGSLKDQAEPYRALPGIYIEAGAGVGWYPTTTWTFQIGVPPDHRNSFGAGDVLRLAVGSRLGYGFRGEIEGSLRSNDVDRTVAGGVTYDLDGRVRSQALMANAFYDFRMGAFGGITPFVGAGVGYAHLDVSSRFAIGGAQALGSDDRLAWQAMAGVAVPLGDLVSVTARYTYFDTVGDRMSVQNLGVSKPIDLAYRNQSVTVGLRLGF